MSENFRAELERIRDNALRNTPPSGETKPAAGIDEEKERIKLLTSAGIMRRYQNVTFENIECRGLPKDEEIRHHYGVVKDYANHLEENLAKGYGLILAGNFGTMKTTMAVAVLQEWLAKGKNGLMVPMCSLIDNLYTMKALSLEEWARYEQKLRNTPLLIIDDLGAENTDQDWILAKVDSIITERYNKMLPVIITTNLGKNELAGTYSARIMDRLRNTSLYLAYNCESQRRTLRTLKTGGHES